MNVDIKNDLLNSILDSLPYPFLIIDPTNYTVSYANSPARIGQLSTGLTCYALSHNRDTPCNSPEDPCPIELVKKTKKPIILEHIHYGDDGNPRHLEVHALPVLDHNHVSQIIEYAIDITERKRAETLLHEAEERYRTLFETSRDAIMTLAPPTWLFTSCNHSTVELFRVRDEAEFISLGPWELSSERQPDDRLSDEKAKEMIETAMRNGSHFFEWTHCHSDGTPFPAEVLLTRIDRSGQEVLLQATVRDITERKRVEEARRVSEARLNTILESAQDGIFLIAFNTAERRYVNQAMADMLGYTKEELLKRRFQDQVDRRTLEAFADIGRRMISTKQAIHGIEYEMVRKNGSSMTVSVTLAPLVNMAGWITDIVGIMRDVTENRNAEEEKDKMLAELREALLKVKTLSGFLPICAYCKKIRDDKGYYHQIESYIRDHSDAEFSHGICPECAKEHFPDVDLYDK